MKFRHSFLIGRAAAFAMLLATAGATSISVAAGAQDARQGGTERGQVFVQRDASAGQALVAQQTQQR